MYRVELCALEHVTFDELDAVGAPCNGPELHTPWLGGLEQLPCRDDIRPGGLARSISAQAATL